MGAWTFYDSAPITAAARFYTWIQPALAIRGLILGGVAAVESRSWSGGRLTRPQSVHRTLGAAELRAITHIGIGQRIQRHPAVGLFEIREDPALHST